MAYLNRILHLATRSWIEQHRNNLLSSSLDVEVQQKSKLRSLLAKTHNAAAHAKSRLSPTMSWREYSQAVPISNYKTWQPWIESSRSRGSSALTSSVTERFQPTSGSTSAVKWIPYSQDFLAEMNNALMAWIADLYRQYPGIGRGHHYWSVSWIPTSLREEVDENINDDLKVLPWWKRWVARQYMAVPETVAQAHTSDDTLFASLAWLVSRRDLTMLSVWSPTFALSLFEQILEYRDELVGVLSRGQWLDRSGSLRMTMCPHSKESSDILKGLGDVVDKEFLANIWPNISLISCWDTASSEVWANRLHRLFPNAALQGKGLWATEGTVTIPFGDKYPLTLNSHYYEFLNINSNEVLPAWGLARGMEVSPILSTGSGLLRYKLEDRLLVTDFLNQCPCFEFQGRIDGADLAGEKISTGTAQGIVNRFSQELPIVPISVVAIPGEHWPQVAMEGTKGCYVLLCEPGVGDAQDELVLSGVLEEMLLKNFHYQLARELKQLAPARVVVSHQAREFYKYRCTQRGMVTGDIKIEPLVLWNTSLPQALVDVFVRQGARFNADSSSHANGESSAQSD